MTIKKYQDVLVQAKKGKSNAQYELGNFYEDGLTVKNKEVLRPNQQEALKWFKKAYKNGNSNAAVRYADYLSIGDHCHKDLELAIKIYKSEITSGNYMAYSNLAKTYCKEKKYKWAIKLYRKIQKEFEINSIELAYCFYFGLGTKLNKLRALEIFKLISKDKSNNRNCESEINEANYYIGMIYLEGRALKRSIKKARKYLTLANVNNDHESAIELLNILGK